MKTLALLLVPAIGMSLCVSEAVARDKAEELKAGHQKALKTLAVILPRDHLLRHPLDEEITHRWFDLFIGRLDRRRIYFTAEDIRRLAKHRDKLDDQARRGDLSFADLVCDTYRKRLRQATKMQTALLDERHDFTADEQFVLQPAEFPANQEALRERWRKRVKYDILVERSAGLTMERAITKLRADYRRTGRKRQFEDKDDLYELFLDAFARSFGPHNCYLGSRTLANFEM